MHMQTCDGVMSVLTLCVCILLDLPSLLKTEWLAD
jgi:hypothetical protein